MTDVAILCTFSPPYQTCGYWMWTQGGGIVTIATLCTLFPIRHVAIGCGLREVELIVSVRYY